MKNRLTNLRAKIQAHVPIPLLLIMAVVLSALFMNDEASITQNYENQKEIKALRAEIKLNKDSAEYYRRKRAELERGAVALEYIAREQYGMKRPSEDVYIIK